MSIAKKNCNSILKPVGFLTLIFLLSLNGRGDTPSPEERAGKLYGLTPEQIKALSKDSEELQHKYDLALKSPEGASQFQAILKKAIANIDAASNPISTSGNNLPASFTELFSKQQGSASNPDIDIAVAKSGFMGLKVDNFFDQFTLGFARELINSEPEILIPILQERANVFPPTVADYILYEQVFGGLGDNEYDMAGTNGSQVPLSRSTGLLSLAQAKNPIYRLLAVKAAEFVEPNETKRLNFYSVFLKESDPTIQTQAILGVAHTKTPTTVSVLQSFQKAAQQNGNTEGADAAQKAIQRLSNK